MWLKPCTPFLCKIPDSISEGFLKEEQQHQTFKLRSTGDQPHVGVPLGRAVYLKGSWLYQLALLLHVAVWMVWMQLSRFRG